MARFAVIGLGRFGDVLARQLARHGSEVLAVDNDPDHIDELRDVVTLAIRMDGTDEQALVAQGVDRVDVAIVSIGDSFEASCLTVSSLKALNPGLVVVARATSQVRGKILSRIGADKVIYPEQESAERLARDLAYPDLLDPDELAPGILQARLTAPAEFVGRSASELALRQKYDINLVAIKRASATPPIVIPQATTKIEHGDVLVLIGNADRIQHLSNLPK